MDKHIHNIHHVEKHYGGDGHKAAHEHYGAHAAGHKKHHEHVMAMCEGGEAGSSMARSGMVAKDKMLPSHGRHDKA